MWYSVIYLCSYGLIFRSVWSLTSSSSSPWSNTFVAFVYMQYNILSINNLRKIHHSTTTKKHKNLVNWLFHKPVHDIYIVCIVVVRHRNVRWDAVKRDQKPRTNLYTRWPAAIVIGNWIVCRMTLFCFIWINEEENKMFIASHSKLRRWKISIDRFLLISENICCHDTKKKCYDV